MLTVREKKNRTSTPYCLANHNFESALRTCLPGFSNTQLPTQTHQLLHPKNHTTLPSLHSVGHGRKKARECARIVQKTTGKETPVSQMRMMMTTSRQSQLLALLTAAAVFSSVFCATHVDILNEVEEDKDPWGVGRIKLLPTASTRQLFAFLNEPRVAADNRSDETANEDLLAKNSVPRQALPERNLIWSRTPLVPCDAQTLRLVLLIDPTVTVCTVSTLQWDPQGWLQIDYVLTVGLRNNPVGGGQIPDTNEQYTAYYDGRQCNSFDSCVLTSIDRTLLEVYSYDCSNVYCGPNAVRDCEGNLYDQPCDGEDPPPEELPTNAQLSCLRNQQLLAQLSDQGDVCAPSECAPVPLGDLDFTTKTWMLGCDPECVGCSETTGKCYEVMNEVFFGEIARANRNCITDDTPEKNTFCFTRVYGPVYLADDGETYVHFGTACTAWWNGNACECNPCNPETPVVEGEPMLLSVDCSAHDEESVSNDCTGDVGGVFADIIATSLNKNKTCAQAFLTDPSQPADSPTTNLPQPTIPSPPTSVPNLAPSTNLTSAVRQTRLLGFSMMFAVVSAMCV